MKTDRYLKTKIIQLNNSLNVADELFDSIYSFNLLQQDNQQSEQFMRLYHSENRLVVEENDGFFHKAFKDFLRKNEEK